MADILAGEGERDRRHIALQNKAEVRHWLKDFGVAKSELQRTVDKAGNSAETNGPRCKGGASSIACNFSQTTAHTRTTYLRQHAVVERKLQP